MANGFSIVRKGESLDFVFDRCGESISGWTCVIQVKQYPSDDSLITEREIDPEGNTWPGYLTSAETASLSSGAYRLIGLLTSTTTEQEEQIMETTRFRITDSWAS